MNIFKIVWRFPGFTFNLFMETRDKMFSEIIVFCFIVLVWPGLQHGVTASCTFPTYLDGTFYSTREGYWTFNSTHYGTKTISTVSQTYSDLEFECHIKNGNYYVGRSTSIDIFTSPFYVYMCLEIHAVSSSFFYYYYSTVPLTEANDEQIKILPSSTSVTSTSVICDDTTRDPGAYSVLLKNGTLIENEAITCPTVLQSYMQYQFTDTSGNLHCNGSSYLDVCSNKAHLEFNYSYCSTNVLYSSGGLLYCLFYMNVSSTEYYVTLYNADATVDGSSTHRLICLLVEGGGNVKYATQYPSECKNTTSMNSTHVISPGGVLLLTTNSSCPVTVIAGETISAAVIGAIAGSMVVFIAIIVALAVLLSLLQKKKKTKGVGPAKMNPIVIKSQGEKNSRTLFTPVPRDSLKMNGMKKVDTQAVTSLISTDSDLLSPSSVAVAMNASVVQRPLQTPASILATSDPDIEVSISEYSDSTETSSPTRMTPTIVGPTPGFTTMTESITASSMTLDSLHSQSSSRF